MSVVSISCRFSVPPGIADWHPRALVPVEVFNGLRVGPKDFHHRRVCRRDQLLVDGHMDRRLVPEVEGTRRLDDHLLGSED